MLSSKQLPYLHISTGPRENRIVVRKKKKGQEKEDNTRDEEEASDEDETRALILAEIRCMRAEMGGIATRQEVAELRSSMMPKQ